jgi:hypothetical protein
VESVILVTCRRATMVEVDLVMVAITMVDTTHTPTRRSVITHRTTRAAITVDSAMDTITKFGTDLVGGRVCLLFFNQPLSYSSVQTPVVCRFGLIIFVL